MQVAKWGNSLAVRIPADVARSLGIEAGDHLDVVGNDGRSLTIRRRLTKDEALARLQARARPLPAGYVFNREELYEDYVP